MRRFNKLIIACDGESASGKSTAAKLVAKKYKLLLLNSGLLYRYASKLIIKHKPYNSVSFLKTKQFFFRNLVQDSNKIAKDEFVKNLSQSKKAELLELGVLSIEDGRFIVELPDTVKEQIIEQGFPITGL